MQLRCVLFHVLALVAHLVEIDGPDRDRLRGLPRAAREVRVAWGQAPMGLVFWARFRIVSCRFAFQRKVYHTQPGEVKRGKKRGKTAARSVPPAAENLAEKNDIFTLTYSLVPDPLLSHFNTPRRAMRGHTARKKDRRRNSPFPLTRQDRPRQSPSMPYSRSKIRQANDARDSRP